MKKAAAATAKSRGTAESVASCSEVKYLNDVHQQTHCYRNRQNRRRQQEHLQ